jgi:lysophospholipase L1-like esterase
VPKKLALAVGSCLVIFSLLEIGQRVSDLRKTAHRAQRVNLRATRSETASGIPIGDRQGSIVLVHDPVLLFRLKAEQRVEGMTVNAQGFRGGNWARDKAAGTRRAIVLGGSAVFGFGVTDGETLAPVLERELNRGRAAGAIEVWNAGVPGFDANQELALLCTEVMDHRPDAVVFCDGWNDFYGATLRPVGSTYEHPFFTQLEEVITQSGQHALNVLRASAFFRGLERRVPEWVRARAAPASTLAGEGGDLARYRDVLARAAAIASAAGIKMVIATQPELFQRAGAVPGEERELRAKYEPGYGPLARDHYPDYVRAGDEAARSANVAFVDCTRVFDDSDGVIFTDPCHLNAAGNERLARRLAPVLAAALGL